MDQLEEWTKRSGVDIHRPAEGQTKPMPVLDDAITRAIDGKYDVVSEWPGPSHRKHLHASQEGGVGAGQARERLMRRSRLCVQLIVDTSGRLSNNVALNEELKKLKNIITNRVPGGPHETLLVLDGAVGRNGVDQVRGMSLIKW